MITPLIRQTVAQLISSQFDPGGADRLARAGLVFQSVGGGSINATYNVKVATRAVSGAALPDSPSGSDPVPGTWFCKINSASRFPGLFEKEARGLALLAAATQAASSRPLLPQPDPSQPPPKPIAPGASANAPLLRIPRVIGHSHAGDDQVLLLEWLPQQRADARSMALLGTGLAQLHRQTADHFGLDEDNYMGSLLQSNTLATDWTEFFIQQRLEPQLKLALDQGQLDRSAIRLFETLYKALPALFPAEPRALLHGDLWSGNYLITEGGRPALFDPAVYYGHRSMDLAMTTLFGGFDESFYRAYQDSYPFPANYQEQWPVCNLYPLLIHLNLFGQSYAGEIFRTLRRFG